MVNEIIIYKGEFMMGFGDWIKDIISVPVEDEEEIITEAVGKEQPVEQQEKTAPAPRTRIFPIREQEQQTQVKPASNIKVVLAKPVTFEDGRAVADHLNAKRTVVLNLEGTNRDISRRLIDFLSGVAYANNGQIKRVANCTYIITPRSVDVMGDMILDELESSGLFNV